jgi:hypothetical protein
MIDDQELRKNIDEAVRRIVDNSAEQALERALVLYLERHGAELLRDVVGIERLKRKTLLTAAEVETLYGIKRRTLDDWRLKKIGPEYEKFGGAIRYRVTTLDAFFRAARVATSERRTLRAAM